MNTRFEASARVWRRRSGNVPVERRSLHAFMRKRFEASAPYWRLDVLELWPWRRWSLRAFMRGRFGAFALYLRSGAMRGGGVGASLLLCFFEITTIK